MKTNVSVANYWQYACIYMYMYKYVYVITQKCVRFVWTTGHTLGKKKSNSLSFVKKKKPAKEMDDETNSEMEKKTYHNTTTKMFEEQQQQKTNTRAYTSIERRSWKKSDVVLVISTGNLFGSCLIYRPCNFIYSRKLFGMRDKNDDAFAMFFDRCCCPLFRTTKLSLFNEEKKREKKTFCIVEQASRMFGFFVAIIMQTYLVSYKINECWFTLKV